LLFNNGAAREKAAWTFLTWLTSAQTHGEFTLATGDLPTRASETKLPAYKAYLAKYPGDAVFVLNLDNVTKARPNTKTYPQVSQAIGSQLQGVLIGHSSPQDALKAAAQQADAALASGP
jgi:multiple sugar transport system substrate-binding protein